MALPYPSAGIPIGPQPRPDDGLGSTSEGRARLAAMRRLSLDQPDMDHAAMMAAAPVAMAEDRAALSAGGPTVLQPSRTSAFNARDAQSLAALDPRALAEANALAPLDQPKKMTGTFGGQSFEMTPSQRVGRDQLAQIYNKYQTKQGEERADDVRGQGFKNQQEIVSIPGRQGIEKRTLELASDERQGTAKRAFETPTRDADIAAKTAGTAAAIGAEKRTQTEHGERVPANQAAIDEQYAKLAASPFAQTPSVRALLKQLAPQTTTGRAAPGQAGAIADAAAPAQSVSEVGSAMLEDPIISAAIKRAKAVKSGHWSGVQGHRDSAAAQQLLNRSVADFASRHGIDPGELRPFLSLAE